MLFGSHGLNFNPNFAFLREENDDLNENKNISAIDHICYHRLEIKSLDNILLDAYAYVATKKSQKYCLDF